MKKSIILQTAKSQLQKAGLFTKPGQYNWVEELQIGSTHKMRKQYLCLLEENGMAPVYNRICTGSTIQDLPSNEIENMEGVTWIKDAKDGLEIYNIPGDTIRKYLAPQHKDKDTGVVSTYTAKIPDDDLPSPDTLTFT